MSLSINIILILFLFLQYIITWTYLQSYTVIYHFCLCYCVYLRQIKIHHFKKYAYGSLICEVSFWVHCLYHLTIWYDHMTFNFIMLWFTQNVSSLFEKPYLAIVSYILRSYWVQLVIYIWFFFYLPLSPSTPPESFPFRKSQAFHGCEYSMVHQL